ncbi:MAG TPA: hypothetical protein VE957_10515 [Terriglobales bacterium]|nr:hypothetical protein [Terriglobales bacterium]HYW38537.1 hypothetical protein [Terriglobales bacterium]
MNAAIPERRPVTEEISGLIERVTFHNDDSGFCVLIGQKKALGIAVRNDRPQRRHSGLLASLKGKKGTERSVVESKTTSQSRVVS